MDQFSKERRKLLAATFGAGMVGYAMGRVSLARPIRESNNPMPFLDAAKVGHTGIFFDESFLQHTRPSYPENASRIKSFLNMAALQNDIRCNRVSPSEDLLNSTIKSPDWADLFSKVHTPKYLADLDRIIDHPQYISKSRWAPYGGPYARRATAAAALGVLELAVRISNKEIKNGYALVRPPAHHAGRSFAEGYCMTNSVAYAAREIVGRLQGPVVILDLDVHHGNGTEDIFYQDAEVVYISLHQDDWPYTGKMERTGEGAGRGRNFNLPLPLGLGGVGWLNAVDQFVRPIIKKVQPTMMLVSMGYDTHWRDPQGSMRLTLTDQALLLKSVYDIATEVCEGHLVVALEGGYDREITAYGICNSLRVLQGGTPSSFQDLVGQGIRIGEEQDRSIERDFLEKLDQARKIHREVFI